MFDIPHSVNCRLWVVGGGDADELLLNTPTDKPLVDLNIWDGVWGIQVRIHLQLLSSICIFIHIPIFQGVCNEKVCTRETEQEWQLAKKSSTKKMNTMWTKKEGKLILLCVCVYTVYVIP